jgi:hypothetical protein
VLLPRAGPGGVDARDVRCELLRHGHLAARADVHRHLAAQRRESGVHLAADGAGQGTLLDGRGPAAATGELRAVLADRERIPDADLAVDQRGHSAGHVQRGYTLSEFRRVEW